jgi:integrase/recombinase XerD
MSTLALELPAGRQETASWEAVAFIASYSSAATRRTYTTQWKLWMDWCADHHLDPLRHPSPARGALRPRTRSPQPVRSHGRAEAGRAHRLLPLLRRRTAARALPRRPRPPPQGLPGVHPHRARPQRTRRLPGPGRPVRRQRPRTGLSARTQRPTVSEACGADLDDLAVVNGHRTLKIVGKGSHPALIPLAPRNARAIDATVGERTDGPLMARADGSRLDRHAAGRIVRRLAKRAGISKPISPHSLRHAAITAALDAGCSLRDVQDYARHADPRQTRRYDRARGATRPQPHLHRRPPTSSEPPAPADSPDLNFAADHQRPLPHALERRGSRGCRASRPGVPGSAVGIPSSVLREIVMATCCATMLGPPRRSRRGVRRAGGGLLHRSDEVSTRAVALGAGATAGR